MVDMDQAGISTRLDAQQRLLRAIARTQSDHTRQFREQGELLRQQDERLDQVQAGTGRVEVGVQAVLSLLGAAGSGADPGPSKS